MEKPGEKLKKILLILGVTGVVYLSFRYLLPLVIPFLLAYIFALSLRPCALWLEKKTRFTIKKRTFSIPLSVIGAVELFLVIGMLGIIFYIGGKKLVIEARLLFENLPQIISRIEIWLMENCTFAEEFLKLPKGYMVHMVGDILSGGEEAIKEKAMSFTMIHSVHIAKWIVSFGVLLFIILIAIILTLQEMDDLRRRRDNSMFCYEYHMVGKRLMLVGSAWLKVQTIIMICTMIICCIGLFFLGNPYFILLGIGIGLLDVLPILGTGTVFIPWTIFSMIGRNWGYGIGIFIIYIICYFLREIMEAKVMGEKVGLTPLETLFSIFVGLQLFGIFGFILGPIGLLIIEDIVNLYSGIS